MGAVRLLTNEADVIRCLITYTDWWQPSTSSVYRIAGTNDRNHGDGLGRGLLDHLDERTELCRRMVEVKDRDKELLVLWYLKQLSVEEIAPKLRISRRQCFRRRAHAIRQLAEVDAPNDDA